ncbi:MAG: GTP cyclohydrolase I FolE [Gammaproteobacteria bacterium]|nr:GTP cyclohydrolase I FolE [Gammaproteobacteria bacterium]
MDHLYRQILENLGEDPQREGLIKTPERAAKALKFLTQGMHHSLAEIVNGAIFEVEANHMVIVKDIEIFSLCEHHMLPFFGRCHIGYVPNGKVLGVSKLARIADMYARRLQVQERLTNQVARAIMEAIEPDGVGVIIEAQHLCMMMRGVEKQTSKMVSSAMLGIFRHYEATRTEFLNLVR